VEWLGRGWVGVASIAVISWLSSSSGSGMIKRADGLSSTPSGPLEEPTWALRGGSFVVRNGVERSCERGATDPARDGTPFIVPPCPTFS
jgi:hypothetical protein